MAVDLVVFSIAILNDQEAKAFAGLRTSIKMIRRRIYFQNSRELKRCVLCKWYSRRSKLVVAKSKQITLFPIASVYVESTTTTMPRLIRIDQIRSVTRADLLLLVEVLIGYCNVQPCPCVSNIRLVRRKVFPHRCQFVDLCRYELPETGIDKNIQTI